LHRKRGEAKNARKPLNNHPEKTKKKKTKWRPGKKNIGYKKRREKGEVGGEKGGGENTDERIETWLPPWGCPAKIVPLQIKGGPRKKKRDGDKGQRTSRDGSKKKGESGKDTSQVGKIAGRRKRGKKEKADLVKSVKATGCSTEKKKKNMDVGGCSEVP